MSRGGWIIAAGVETGQIYRTKRQMQGAADAAALAGSIDRIAAKTSSVSNACPAMSTRCSRLRRDSLNRCVETPKRFIGIR